MRRYIAGVYWKAFLLLALLGGQFAAHSATTNTPAHAALRLFSKGVNFGNYLEAPRTQNWGAKYSEADLDAVKKEGFDHVRLPIRWNDYAGAGPEFKIEQQLFDKVDFLVTNALSRGLSIIINIHHFDELTTDPKAEAPKFYALWKQIAEHYAKHPNRLAFELLNEPKDAATTEVMNPIYAEAIRVIRQSNPNRTIFVGPGKWNSLDEVEKLKLPENDRNLVVTVHCYDPFLFTHQGASWTRPSTDTTGIIYPGPPSKPVTPAEGARDKKWFERYNTLPTAENPSSPIAFTARMEKVARWGAENGRPIHLGEFGAYEKADRESRIRYYRDMRKTAERLGFGWAIWDWKAGFKYWTGEAPVDGMREGLHGK
ncbi:MAG TPA: glycoside hydrolase family 5 protein [Verrucomicrobiae bacterium]